jgi:hypothetical protein
MRADLSLKRRRGGVTIWMVVLILTLFALVAFSADLNYIWTTDTELQNAADAAALACADQLLAPNTVACLPNTSPSTWDNLELLAQDDAVRAAKARAASESAAGASVVLNDADVEVGYIENPAAAPGTPAGAFLPFASNSNYFPNSVRVTVHRDDTVPAGPLRLCFGPILGTSSVGRQVKATASLRGQNVVGFNGAGSRLLPIAMGLDAHNALLGKPNDPSGNLGDGLGGLLSILNLQNLLYLLFPPAPPPGVKLQDLYSVALPIAGGGQPPSDVVAGPDGIIEAHVSPTLTQPGEFYLVSLRDAAVSDDPTYVSWILKGPSKADLASFGPNGLHANALTPATMYAGPKLDSNMDAALKSVVGQTRIVPVYQSYNTVGVPTYQVIGFAAVVVVAVDLSGPVPYVILQPTATVDPSALLGGGASVGTAAFVYQRVSLTR